MRVGQAAADAIYRNFNETFIVGVPPMLLYPAPGAAMDWTKSIGVKYSYAIEVRPGSDFGNEGFLATLEMIRPSGQDILVALKAMVTEAQAISVWLKGRPFTQSASLMAIAVNAHVLPASFRGIAGKYDLVKPTAWFLVKLLTSAIFVYMIDNPSCHSSLRFIYLLSSF